MPYSPGQCGAFAIIERFVRTNFDYRGGGQEFGQPLSYDWITIHPPENREYIRILKLTVDLGEASTIALAIEKSGSVPILDDVKARKLAERLQLNFTGLLGVLLKAKQQDLISTVADLLTELKSAGFRIAADVEQGTLRLAGEEE